MLNPKKYIDYLNEIDDDCLYQGLFVHGMFSSRLPNAFTNVSFERYCSNSSSLPFSKNEHGYITVELSRNTNHNRLFSIPTPMAYQMLCVTLKEHWNKLKRILTKNTSKEVCLLSSKLGWENT